MVVFMCDSNKAYCHQGVKNPDRNYPAGWIDVDSIVLQEPSPLSASLNHAIIIHPATNYVKHLVGAKGEGWKERIGGNHWAFPLYADGKIYFFSQEGKASVISATRAFKLLAENECDASFIASPAVAGNAMILRSLTHLYRVEKITKTSKS